MQYIFLGFPVLVKNLSSAAFCAHFLSTCISTAHSKLEACMQLIRFLQKAYIQKKINRKLL